MATTTTALMPIDPAVSRHQANRVLPIRANLLPTEVTAGRLARRIRTVLVGAALLVIVLQGLWYFYAVEQKEDADAELAAATQQVATAQARKNQYRDLTDTINQQKAIEGQLAKLLRNDLPWAGTLDTIRTAGATAGATVTEIAGTLSGGATAAAPAGDLVATLTISGTAADKKTIATFIDGLAKLDVIANPYLTVATQNKDLIEFSLTAGITAEALCGRHTAACKTGGN